MAIRIKSRSGESVEQMMRRFKKLCEKEGLTKDIKRKEFYEKPSERRRRAARKSINRRLKAESMVPGAAPAPAAAGGRPSGGRPSGGRPRP
jgi:small subunit ribosomal protein S21